MIHSDYETLLANIAAIANENDYASIIETLSESTSESETFSSLQLILALREKAIVLMLDKGILPPLNLIRLFPIIHRKFSEYQGDKRLENHLAVLKIHLSNVEKFSYEYFLIVDLIFILEILNFNPNQGLIEYLSAMMHSNIHEADKYPEGKKLFKEVIHFCGLTPDEMLDIIVVFVNLDAFFKKEHEAQQSLLIWIMLGIWIDEKYGWSLAFYKLYQPLHKLMVFFLELNQLNLSMKIYNLAHFVFGNLFTTQKELTEFNNLFTVPISLIFKDFYNNSSVFNEPTSPKKIAFIRDRLVNNSTHRVEYSLIKSLMKDKNFKTNYQVYIYSVGYIEIAFDDFDLIKAYESLGVDVRIIPDHWYKHGYYYDDLDKAMIIRNDILREKIDIIIGMVGNNSVINFLFSTRTAPKQIYWSHGNHQYDIDGLDQRISHINKASPYPFSFFKSNTLDVFLKGDKGSDQYKKRALEIRAAYGEDTLIFGSIGRLIKIDNDDYILAVAQSLKKHQNSIYLACGLGNIDSIKEKFDVFGVGERLFFPGFVDPHEYGYVLDIYLNTFPETGGESVDEFLSKGEEKYLVSYVDSVERYQRDVDTVVDYIDYIKIKNKPVEIVLPLTNKIKLCTDVLTCIEDAEFIIDLLNKHETLVYLIQENALNEIQTYVIEKVPFGKVQKVHVGTIFEYADLADIYIFLDNYQLRNLMLWKKKKIVLWNTLGEKIDGSIKNLYSKINQDHVSMNSLSQILNVDPKLFQNQDSIYKLFGIMCAQGGLNQIETELFWNSPETSIERNKLFFDLMILHEPLRKIFQEYIYLNCSEIYKDNMITSNTAEFITLLEEKN